MSAKDDLQLASFALEAWGPTLSQDAPGMRIVAMQSAYYAIVDDKSRQIVIDKQAVVESAIRHGSKSTHNAARSLHSQLRKFGFSADVHPRMDERQIEIAQISGLNVVLSHSMRETIIPLASRIAQMTIQRTNFDLRHLLMAMLHEYGDEWASLDMPRAEKYFLAMRQAIVEPLVKNHETGERIDVWQRLIAEHPDQVEPKLRFAGSQPLAMQKEALPTPTSPQKKAASFPKSPPIRAEDSNNIGKTAAAPPPEALPIHTDDPAIVDLLGREGFAEVLAQRIVQAHERAAAEGKASKDDDDNRAFIVHMHGPWGSGKSTVLNFVRKRLEAQDPNPWLVVEFNAWRSQRLKPPWWSLILQIERTAMQSDNRGFYSRIWLRLRWHWMRVRADVLPALAGAALIILAIWLGFVALSGTEPKTGAPLPLSGGEIIKSIGAIASALIGIYAFGRSLLFGSGTAAKAYEDLRSDPYGPMMKLFARLIRAIDRPIIVFIDDLDRCESGYVCDLLESIQTMLRAAPITYLIAADRKWICTSFEKRYADFAGQASDVGRPLGYQFLDKLFQVSANLPIIPASLREGFWNGLLHTRPADAAPSDGAEAEKEAKIKVEAAPTPEARHALIAKEADPVKQQAIRAQVAVKQSSPVEVAKTEHRLKALGALIEPNPRSMKRLANAVGMNQARLTLEGRDSTNIEAIARWTVIDLRWPLLADWLREEPGRIAAKPLPATADAVDKAMAALLKEAEVARVIGTTRATGRLTPTVLSGLVA